MTELIDFDVAQNANDIHHGGVKLKTEVGGAGVVAHTKQTLSSKGKTHRIEDTHLLWNSNFLLRLLSSQECVISYMRRNEKIVGRLKMGIPIFHTSD